MQRNHGGIMNSAFHMLEHGQKSWKSPGLFPPKCICLCDYPSANIHLEEVMCVGGNVHRTHLQGFSQFDESINSTTRFATAKYAIIVLPFLSHAPSGFVHLKACYSLGYRSLLQSPILAMTTCPSVCESPHQ